MLKPRITGTEMEWSCLVQRGPQDLPAINDDCTSKRHIATYLPPNLVHSDSFYSNGARIYVDVGQHIEYATPEDSSFMGTVANEIAGERIMHYIMEKARKEGEVHAFALNKRVVDDNGSTWGYHESYLADATSLGINDRSLALLGVHLGSRGVFFGAGAIYKTLNGGFDFHVTQKSARLDYDFATGTTGGQKPVVNLRNEAHASPAWLRVHVTSGDPNMSPWATFVKLGTTSLVLRLIEHGERLEKLRVNSLVQLASQVAIDTSLQQVVKLVDGSSIKPYEIQSQLCEAAQKLSEDVDLPLEERLALDEWQKACDDIKRDPALLRDRADWIAKKIKLDQYAEIHGLTYASIELQKKDRQWDIIDAAHGIGTVLRQKAWQQPWMPDEALINSRVTTPPNGTRAIIRGNFIKAFPGVGQANWDRVMHGDRVVHLQEPYMVSSPKVDNLARRLSRSRRVSSRVA